MVVQSSFEKPLNKAKSKRYFIKYILLLLLIVLLFAVCYLAVKISLNGEYIRTSLKNIVVHENEIGNKDEINTSPSYPAFISPKFLFQEEVVPKLPDSSEKKRLIDSDKISLDPPSTVHEHTTPLVNKDLENAVKNENKNDNLPVVVSEVNNQTKNNDSASPETSSFLDSLYSSINSFFNGIFSSTDTQNSTNLTNDNNKTYLNKPEINVNLNENLTDSQQSNKPKSFITPIFDTFYQLFNGNEKEAEINSKINNTVLPTLNESYVHFETEEEPRKYHPTFENLFLPKIDFFNFDELFKNAFGSENNEPSRDSLISIFDTPTEESHIFEDGELNKDVTNENRFNIPETENSWFNFDDFFNIFGSENNEPSRDSLISIFDRPNEESHIFEDGEMNRGVTNENNPFNIPEKENGWFDFDFFKNIFGSENNEPSRDSLISIFDRPNEESHIFGDEEMNTGVTNENPFNIPETENNEPTSDSLFSIFDKPNEESHIFEDGEMNRGVTNENPFNIPEKENGWFDFDFFKNIFGSEDNSFQKGNNNDTSIKDQKNENSWFNFDDFFKIFGSEDTKSGTKDEITNGGVISHENCSDITSDLLNSKETNDETLTKPKEIEKDLFNSNIFLNKMLKLETNTEPIIYVTPNIDSKSTSNEKVMLESQIIQPKQTEKMVPDSFDDKKEDEKSTSVKKALPLSIPISKEKLI